MASARQRIAEALHLLGKRKEPDVAPASGGAQRSATPDAQQGSRPSKTPRSVFRPWDQRDLHRRLETFRPLTWFGKPDIVGPIACASRGWFNEERDKLCCEFCSVRLIYPQLQGAAYEARARAATLFAEQLGSKHDAHCPWKSTVCDNSVLAFDAGSTSPAALHSEYQARLSDLGRIDPGLPDVYSRALQLLVRAAAAALFAPGASSPLAGSIGSPSHQQGRGGDKLSLQDPSAAAVAAVRRVLGLPVSQAAAGANGAAALGSPRAAVASPVSGQQGAGASGSGTNKGSGSGEDETLGLPAKLTTAQKARLLALLGWECEELPADSVGRGIPTPSRQPRGSISPGGSTLGTASVVPLSAPYRPSSAVYSLAHLVGASAAGKGRAETPGGGHAVDTKPRMSLANAVLHCPTCKTKVGLWNYAQAAARSALAASGAPTSTATDTAPPSASGGQAGQAAGAVPSSGTSVTIPAHSSSIPAPVPVVPLIKTIAGGSYTAPAGPGPFGQPRLSGGDDVFGLSAAAGPSNLPPGSSAPVVGLASLTGPSSSSAAAGHTASIAASPAPAHPPSSTTSTPSIPRAAQRASGAGAVTPAATPTGATRAEAGTARPSGSSTSSLHETFDPVGQHRSWCPWVFTGGEQAGIKVKCGWMYLLEALLAPPQAPQQGAGGSVAQDQDVVMTGATPAGQGTRGLQAGPSAQGQESGSAAAASAGAEGSGADAGVGAEGAAQLKQTILDTLRRL